MVAVVGSACTTSSGAYDDLNLLADFAEREGLWFHVDGAHGAPAVFSDTHGHLVSGMGRAHSMAMDFHKIMGVPALCTGLFYGRHDHSFLPFTQAAEYLWSDAEEPEWWNFGKRTFECTKRMLSTRVAAVLEEHGEDIWGHFVDRLFGLGRALADLIEAREDFELAMVPEANIVCFRYSPECVCSLDAAQQDRSPLPCGNVTSKRTAVCGPDPFWRTHVVAVHLDESVDGARGFGANVGPGGRTRPGGHSTVTLLARLRG